MAADSNSSTLGFTLVELLVTISIIAVLSAIGLITYITVLQGGRDAKRLSDLASVQGALEQYRVDQGFYPTSLNLTSGASFTSASGNPHPPASSKTYLNNLPIDPKNSDIFIYLYQPIPKTGANCDNETDAEAVKCSSYCLYANVEKSSNAKNLTNCTPPSGSYNYEVSPP